MNRLRFLKSFSVRHAGLRLGALVLLAVVADCSQSRPAWGQLFGARSVGNPISSAFNSRPGGMRTGSPTAAGPEVGMLDGSERFVRGNRSSRDFVGSDRNEQAGFVGAGQAIGVGRVRSATEGLRIESSDTTRLNRPLPAQSRKGLYYPRLEIAFDRQVDEPASEPTSAMPTVNARISERVAKVVGKDVELTFEGRTAILSGSVDSQHAAELAEQLLRFEPGIDRVDNKLRVATNGEVVPLPRL